jgi:hypothetical protein
MSLRLCLCSLTLLLVGCDSGLIPGLGPDPRAVQKEADSKAIGGACRYGLRSIEDCYALNPRATKSHIFTGWKDMDQYMRDNKIDGAASTVSAQEEVAAAPPPAEKTSAAKPEVKPKVKSDSKPEAVAAPTAH